jgi:hypothetical protein
MIDIFYNPHDGVVLPDAAVLEFCNLHLDSTNGSVIVSSESMLYGFRYCMKIRSIPVQNVQFWMFNGTDYDLVVLTETYKVPYPGSDHYPHFTEDLLFTLL